MHLYKRNFKPHENDDESTAKSTNMDLVALKLLVGKTWNEEETIQEVLFEID